MNEQFIVVAGIENALVEDVLSCLECHLVLLGWQLNVTDLASLQVARVGDRQALWKMSKDASEYPSQIRVSVARREARTVYVIPHTIGSGDPQLLQGVSNSTCLTIGVYINSAQASSARRSGRCSVKVPPAKLAHLSDRYHNGFGRAYELNNCSVVIDLSFDDISNVSVEIFSILKAWLAGKPSAEAPRYNFLPSRARNGGKQIAGVLDEGELVCLLNQAVSYAHEHRTLVVQGGNRYISSFLAGFGLDSRYIKLACISKTRLSTFVYSMLEPADRALALNSDQEDELMAWKQLRRRHVRSRRASGLTVGDAALLLGDCMIPVPFSYPADDRRIRSEFGEAAAILSDRSARQLCTVDEAGALFCSLLGHTKFWDWLQRADEDLLFIDDTFYRGRTFYAAGIIARLLSRKDRWKFLALTADRVGRLVVHPRLIIGSRQSLYPYENSIATEAGYWDLLGEQYVWRDLVMYANLLSEEVRNAWVDAYAVRSIWRRMMMDVLAPLHHSPDIGEIVLALFELAIACAVEGRQMDVASLQDQRGWGLGYSAAFASVMMHWIAQEEPRWKRQRYKDWVARMLLRMNALVEERHARDVLLAYYRENATALEYSLLSSFIGTEYPTVT